MAKKRTPSTKWQDMAKSIASLVEESSLVLSADELKAIDSAMDRIFLFRSLVESTQRLNRFKKQHPKYYKMLSDLTGHCIKYIEPKLQKSIGKAEYLRGQPLVYVHQVCLYDDFMDYRVVLNCRIADPKHWEGEEVNYSFELGDLSSGKVQLQPVPNSDRIAGRMAKRFMPLQVVFKLGSAPREY